MKVAAVKSVRIWAAIVLLFVSCFALMSCQSDEDAVRAKADEGLSEIKNLDDAAIDGMLKEFEEDESFDAEETFEMLGISMHDLVKSMLTDFDYTIDEVSVDGDKATVKATLTHKSISEAMTTWQTEFGELISGEDAANMTESELFAKAGEMLLDNINKAPMNETEVELPYVKNGNNWEPSEEAENILGEVFAGGLE